MSLQPILNRITLWRKHLLSPMLSVFYLVGIPVVFSFHSWVWVPGLFFISIFFTAGYGYWLNDLFDIELDQKAGKNNFLERRSSVIKWGGLVLFVLIGMGCWFLLEAPLMVSMLFLSFYILLSLYSIPPFRFKNNPILGPLCDIHYAHVLVVFVPLLLFEAPILSNIPFLCILYGVCFIKGARNILLHQLEDRKGDAKSGLHTFPIKFKPLFTIQLVNRLLVPLEFMLIILLLIYSWNYSPLFTYGFASFILFYFLNFSGWLIPFIPSHQLKFKFAFVFNDFYEYWLPYLCIWASGLTLRQKIVLSLLHAIIFFSGLKKTWKDLRKIFKNLGF